MPKEYKGEIVGEGLLLYNAIQASNLSVEEIVDQTPVSRGSLYNYYYSETLSDKVKKKFARLLNKSVETIFGINSNNSKISSKPEVIALNTKVPMRLTADEHADAFPNWQGVPVYNVEVSASFVTKYTEEESRWEPLYYLRDPQFRDCDFAARIAGDSMHSEIRHGDYIICQEITDKSIIVFGEIYYIVTSNGLQTCKYINAMPIYGTDPQDTRKMYDYDRLLLVPKNDNISPTPLNRTEIDRLYKVKGIVRGY